ncbi:hypothetical protein R1flu_007071 [Riccia fluitans]|uniref:Transducin beta-like protein 2 n=1 Tax=Riccia fluitans TaxID=41844 RepID=A0ABD1Z0V1_9MARC
MDENESAGSSAASGEGGLQMWLLTALLGVIAGLVVVLVPIFKKRQEAEKRRKEAEEIQKVNAQQQQQHRQPPAQAAKKAAIAAAKAKAAAIEKAHAPRHHLDLVTLKGHGDEVTGVAFTSNGRGLATACADQVVRVFKLDDAFNKSFKFLRLNLPRGSTPTAVAFGEGASQLIVATQDIGGAGLCMFASGGGKAAADAKQQGKLPLPEIKWEMSHIHDQKNIISLVGAPASHGSGDGSVVVASCSEGTDIKLWKAADGKNVGNVDTNQLQNTMATLSPDGRFLSAAAFTADVKIWELVYGKDGQIKEVTKVMQLKGHKSAVTWLCFTWDSERMITASKDGTIRVWNINVRYHLDEDPKCLKNFSIPSKDAKGKALSVDRLAVSPDNKVLALTHDSLLQWLNVETGEVIDTCQQAHDGKITTLVWSPQPVPTDRGKAAILATAGTDKRVKLWIAPSLE